MRERRTNSTNFDNSNTITSSSIRRKTTAVASKRSTKGRYGRIQPIRNNSNSNSNSSSSSNSNINSNSSKTISIPSDNNIYNSSSLVKASAFKARLIKSLNSNGRTVKLDRGGELRVVERLENRRLERNRIEAEGRSSGDF